MNSTYTVKNGDTLGAIAHKHGTTVADLQALNPSISDPNYIKPGWQLKLPGAPAPVELPPPMHAHNTSSITAQGQPQCDEELVDVAHITGERDFFVLTEKQSKALKLEIDRVQTLMDALHQNLAEALPITQCKLPQDPNAYCTCTRCVKDAWALKAQGAGLLMRQDRPPQASPAPLTTDKDLQGQLATLQQARDWYQRYSPSLVGATRLENNWQALQAKKVKQLDEEIAQLRGQLAAQIQAEPEDSSSNANGAVPDLKYGRGRVVESERGKKSTTGVSVVEIILFSDPSRRHFISIPYRETTTWNVRVSTQVMAGKPFSKQLAKDLITDIKEAVDSGRKAGPLGNLEFKLSSWSSAEDNLLNALHKEVSWTSDQSDASRYGVTAEAHALRFAASASAGVNSWDPKEGNVDVGVKGSAAFSLAEGSASLVRYFPSQGGYVASMSYRNALGQEVLHPMGVFRMSGKLELSCFVGANVQGEAGVKVQYKPTETSAGATALLGSPTMEVGTGGNIGVKADAFAGAQAGGALTGALEWVEPEKQGTGGVMVGQANSNGSWVALAEVKAEGNVAVGIGASGEFGLSIARDRLAINCKGSVVLGPGASGGFATTVELEQIGKLTLLFCNALADMDYRYLLSVSQEAFKYITSGLYQVVTSPITKAVAGFEFGREEMRVWWERRDASKAEAENLASYITLYETNRAVVLHKQNLPFGMLPPETLGPMVYVLVEGFVDSFNERQEEALVILLSEIKNWRQFVKVLEHCSPKGEPVDAIRSLERINSLLDGYEQYQFNLFVESLAVNKSFGGSSRVAWKTSNAWRKEKVLIAARNSGVFDGLV
ncbi:LysM peptidoglycan-binding domain-containing protein [Pseudomonas sp. V1]|uniref:LysM peptidoglycan-binding domain-containing protein n=1 Tax=Pseudomonas arcuscaelestis TaxID=2710591 RepID=UPI00193F6CAC|nr:LysM peptidoglycan-binding domain-containing protein [Pseudomonas arcuscaelestis]MBM3103493.1 LysM peptidoglycan-binding domain-containing protein [Pseudomonas arcuscaelestis]